MVRTYASVRHFARWIHHKMRPFPLGCPTDGIKPPEEPEPEWKGLSCADELRLLNAAQTLRVRPGRGFKRVLIKGGRIRDFVPVQTQARQVLEEWLAVRGDEHGPLFTTRSGQRLSRT